MKFARHACALGAVLVLSTPAFAQSPAPVAVPLVGSPAAQTPVSIPASAPSQPPTVAPQPSAAPPQVPSQPPSVPSNMVTAAPFAPRGERKLDLSFSNGTVALDAQNVSVREVVAEWQRRGGCQFVHADQLPAAPVALQLPAGTPELDALDSLFRALATPTTGYGYIVAPSTSHPANKSSCGAVYILATSRPSASASYGAAPVQAPVVAPIRNPDDELPPVTPFSPIQRPQIPGQPAATTPPPAAAPQNSSPATPLFGPVAPNAPGVVPLNPSAAPAAPQPNGTPAAPNGMGR